MDLRRTALVNCREPILMHVFGRRIILWTAGISALFLFSAMIEDTVQRMLRGHELLSAVYQTILSESVEEVDADALFQSGIKGMLGHLDPYAELIEQRENSEVDVLARGAYSGIGVKVRRRDRRHIVSDIYDEVRPLTNLRIGDQLLRIDSVDLRTSEIDDLRPLLRGQPGSAVNLLVRRPGISDSLELRVLRRSVAIDPLPLHEIRSDGILYMKLSRFTRSVIDSVARVLDRAYASGRIRGIVIDVRDNPGGLLEAAVSVVDNFIDPGTPIVSMKGRQPGYARMYRSKTIAVDAAVPIAVLVNARSASAAEILAGALQDLDRAVILGQRTFGKGLVQTLLPLNYNAWLKLTTSKYYIPSGRCIQRFAYTDGRARRVSDDEIGPVFRTLRLDRPVRESNGIIPDITITTDSLSGVLASLERHDAYFSFVSLYVNRKSPLSVPAIDNALRAEFMRYADSLAVSNGDALTDALSSLRNEAQKQNMDDSGMRHIDEVAANVRRLNAAQFDAQWDVIRARLLEEFTFQIEGDRARMRLSMESDKIVKRAVQLLSSERTFDETLRLTHSD
jgi:carboxyl-terminal processing protease